MAIYISTLTVLVIQVLALFRLKHLQQDYSSKNDFASHLPADFVLRQRQHSEQWHHREVVGWYTGHLVIIQVEFFKSGITSQG